VAVLKGQHSSITTTDGQVVLNLVPMLNAALGQMEGVISGIVGHSVNLPTISASDIPADACARVSSALGVNLPSTCAQIPLFPADKLTQAQDLVKTLRRAVIALWIVTPIIGILALWVSDRRRRTALQLLVAGTLGLVVFRRVVIWLRDTLVNTGNPANKAAREAILSHVLHGFFLATTWFLVGFIVVAVVVAVTGPYAWARTLRRKTVEVTETCVRAVRDYVEGGGLSGQAAWISNHVELLQFGGVVLGIILLLALPLSFIGSLILVALVALYEIGLQRLKHQRPPTGGDSAPTGGESAPQSAAG
jgi:hypothetical protein